MFKPGLLLLLVLTACATTPIAVAPTQTPAPVVPTQTPAPVVRITDMTASTSEIERFARIELTLTIDAAYQNPFDADQIDVQGIFTAPDGQQSAVPAFYWQDYASELQSGREVLTRRGDAAWKIRFTPAQVGSWTYTAVVKTPAGRDERPPQSFDVTPSTRHGFLRVSPQDPAYLRFDDGTPYVAIGQNVSWYGPGGTHDYVRWFGKMGANGANFARLWMASWALGIEWQETGLGDYTARLDRAWQLDRVFELAAEHDIYLMLSLLNHGAFSTTTNPEWAQNPYNAALGGPCAEPDEFTTNPQARELFKRRLRYIAARWGYSPHLLAWEWWNEVDLTPLAERSTLTPWVREMSAYLQTVDPAAHLRTISYAQSGSDVTATMPEIDLVQRHTYSSSDPILAFPGMMRELRALRKPWLIGEFGYSGAGTDANSPDRTGVHLHSGLWAGIFSRGAGTGMTWWWDTYVDPLDLYGQFAGPSDFLRGEDLAAHGYKTMQAELSTPEAAALLLQSPERVLGWIKSSAFTYRSVERQAGSTSSAPEFPSVVDANITITGLASGSYEVEWWNTRGEGVLQQSQLTVSSDTLALPVPTFDEDLAFKIVRSPSN